MPGATLWLAEPHRSLPDGPAVAWFARKHGTPVFCSVWTLIMRPPSMKAGAP